MVQGLTVFELSYGRYAAFGRAGFAGNVVRRVISTLIRL